MFLSTFEKQLDQKRRIVVPVDFRALASGPFDGVFCFPSIEADCLEGGGLALFDQYKSLIDELSFGVPLRSALETVVLVGLGDRYPIWERGAFHAHRENARKSARQGLAALREAQRLTRTGGGAG